MWRSPKLHPEILPGGVIRPGVGIAARGSEALMAERLLHKMGGGAAVERVGGVGVPKPVRGDVLFDARGPSGLTHNTPELTAGERAVRLL